MVLQGILPARGVFAISFPTATPLAKSTLHSPAGRLRWGAGALPAEARGEHEEGEEGEE
jgi:hypothetical protein